MKKLKTNFLLFSLLSCSLGMSAQTKIGYSYDAIGNRVKRELVLSRSQSQEAKRSVAYSDMLSDHQIQIVPHAKSGKVKVSALDSKTQFDVMVYNVSGQNVLALKRCERADGSRFVQSTQWHLCAGFGDRAREDYVENHENQLIVTVYE